MVISNEKLATFFEDRFKEKEVELQPEVFSPSNFPHILPPNNLIINSNPPDTSEVQEVIKKSKNGKCLGTDSLHTEHLKYNDSPRFIIYFMLLLTTIWTTFIIPSSWLKSSITCLFKNKALIAPAG